MQDAAKVIMRVILLSNGELDEYHYSFFYFINLILSFLMIKYCLRQNYLQPQETTDISGTSSSTMLSFSSKYKTLAGFSSVGTQQALGMSLFRE